MAITRAQQAKQMLQNGGMLVQPGFGGARQGYRGAGEYGDGSEEGANSGGGSGNGGNGGREDRIGNQYSSPEGKAVDRGLENERAVQNMLTGLKQTISPNVIDRGKSFLGNLPSVRALTTVKDFITNLGGPKTKNNLGIEGYNMANIAGPVDRDFGPEDGEGGNGLFAPITSSGPMTSGGATSGAISPNTGANLNRIAYRLMADGGAVIDDEPRQAYGLGSIVKKAARAVKKVAKSDLGKAAIIAGLSFGIPGTNIGGLFGRASFGGPATGLFGQKGIAATLAAGKAKFLGGQLSPNLVDEVALTGKQNLFQRLAGSITPGKAIAGIAGLSALPLLGVGVEEEDEAQAATSPYLTEGLDIAAIRANPRKFQGQAYRLMSEGGSTDLSDDPNYKGWVKVYEKSPDAAEMNEKHSEYLNFYERNKTKQAEGSKEPVAKKVMPLLDMDGMEKDYRETGGFVDMGRMEKADDVPARLSKNEFVFTADAVRNAGDGSVDKGAEVMYNMMKNLEAGGEVSEESQGLEGARKMFQTSQRLEEVL